MNIFEQGKTMYTQNEFNDALAKAKAEIMATAIQATKYALEMERNAYADIALAFGQEELANGIRNHKSTKQQAEPVAWTTMPEAEDWCFVSGGKDPTGKLEGKWFPLYTTPPQRPWQGLTEEEYKA